VITRFLAVTLIAGGLSFTLPVRAGEEPQVTNLSRETREMESEIGFAHVRSINAPKRTVAPTTIGQEHLKAAGKDLQVIGSISDLSVSAILSQIHQQFGKRAARHTKVTGDEQYAVVDLGDRKRDPCCFGTLLFSKRQSEWVLVTEFVLSH
jgi:hypothetical protein